MDNNLHVLIVALDLQLVISENQHLQKMEVLKIRVLEMNRK